MDPTEHRAAVIAGLRELAQFLEDHPDLLCDKYPLLSVYPGTDTPTEGDEAQRAEVDTAAAILGGQPTTSRAGHYMVAREFGGVEYRVCHIPSGKLPACEAVSPAGSVPCKGVAGHDGDHAAEGSDGKIAHVWRQDACTCQPLVTRSGCPVHGVGAGQTPTCARCKTNPVYKPDAIWPDGKPGFTALYCYGCIDRCHEATDFAHICQICASPEEARARGWEVRS